MSKITSTITLALFQDGTVKQIVITPNLSTANIIEAPLAGLVWGESFEPITIDQHKVSVSQPSDIIDAVCEYFNVKADTLKKRWKPQVIVTPRFFARYFLKKKTNLGLGSISTMTGGKEHTSAIYSLRKLQEMIEQDEVIHTHYMNLCRYFNVQPEFSVKANRLTVVEKRKERVLGVYSNTSAMGIAK